MAVNVLNSTTLSAALNKIDNEFAVASTTNISVGSLLAVRGEFMHVREIPVSGLVKVRRGYNGTRALAHSSGAKVWIGTGTDFKAIVSTQMAVVGDSGVYPDYLLPGCRAYDNIGNEYILVELGETSYKGTSVTISMDGNFSAIHTVGGTQGPVGVTVEPGTSDQFVWAQIYGYNGYAQLNGDSSAATSAYIAVPATSLSTPNVGLSVLATPTTAAAYYIHGMFLVGAAVTSDATSATSYTGTYIPVFLNYPFVRNIVEHVESSNS